MKISRIALSAMIAGACFGGSALGQQAQTTKSPVRTVSYNEDAAAAPAVGCTSPSCDTSGACDGAGSCDGLGCGCGAGFGLLGNCCLGEPWKLCDSDVCGWTVGGWTSVGYHTQNTQFNFNNYQDRVQLGQQWFFLEKIADGSEGLGFGGRVDYVYGTDAPDTQSFGIVNNHWDNGWDNGGAYGNALPQAYGEVAYGKLSTKIGHFFTIVGNEVVQSTGNFFYSRQFTFYNAEPFTHTGALTTYQLDDDTQLYNGWVSGWDSGFERNGSAYLGGFKRQIDETTSLIYTTCIGRFGKQTAEDGAVHSAIFSTGLTDNLTYLNQADVLYTTDAAGNGRRNTFGNIHYLIYKVNDCVSLGQRFEWFNFGGNGFANRQNDDLYNYTVGVNYKATANLLFRPEVRWVWDRERFGFLDGGRASQAIFGTDMVFTF